MGIPWSPLSYHTAGTLSPRERSQRQRRFSLGLYIYNCMSYTVICDIVCTIVGNGLTEERITVVSFFFFMVYSWRQLNPDFSFLSNSISSSSPIFSFQLISFLPELIYIQQFSSRIVFEVCFQLRNVLFSSCYHFPLRFHNQKGKEKDTFSVV